MQFKPVPEPPADLEAAADVRAAVPEASATDAVYGDCCARVVDRTPVESRDEAGTWLTFLRALRLVAEDDGEYVRTDDEFDPETLRAAFRERVYGAEPILEALEAAAEPIDTGTVADRVRVGERSRASEPDASGDRRGTRAGGSERDGCERVERLLEWAVLLDLAARTDGGYRLGPAADTRSS